MSYCRFENTLGDLKDCHAALRGMFSGEGSDGVALGESEKDAAIALAREALEMLESIAAENGIPVGEISHDHIADVIERRNAAAEKDDDEELAVRKSKVKASYL